uniref:Long-chain-fatty-acid--CoA ligase n=2 Tax=Panagrolaimus sp. JU765 TaxID=591449 RepID=A0AC34QHB7_9BILA
MVKDSSLYVLPLNIGSRLVDLTEWATNGSQLGSGYYVAAAATLGTMGLGWYVWSSNRYGKITPLVDPQSQTRILPDGSRVCRYLKTNNLMKSRQPDALTLFDAIRRGARVSNNGPMLGQRIKQDDGTEPYVWMKYNEVIERSVNVGMAMRQIGIPAGQNSFIGIYAKNRQEWIIVEHATYNFNNVLVPLYETLGAEACIFTLNQTEIQIVFCDTVEKAKGLLKQSQNIPSLKYFVVMDVVAEEMKAEFKDANMVLYSFEEFETLGKSAEKQELMPPKPDDLSTICYTSGTTGTPKGVMLTHGNVIADGTTLEYFKNTELTSDDVMISFLPLAHMFERVVQSVMMTQGAKIGFFRGDIRGLPDDIKTLQPTLLPVVPRVLNRLYDKVMSEVNKSTFRKALFEAALAYKRREINSWVLRHDSFVDNLVFKKIRDGLGGKVRLMITGSAPLAENVLTFIRCALGCAVVEGYGQTECVAAASITMEGDCVPGHVGIPSPCNAIKLVDVPELGYFAKDNAGEVCIKGPNVFKGYYKNEEQTRETIDSDGWLHTGDIGRWTDVGTLKIVDRKKHIFKLAQGEYVAPEKIENIYGRSKFVAQSFIHGESLKTCLIGIIVPDPEVLPNAVKNQLKLEGLSMEDLCENADVKKMIMDDMLAVGKAAGLYSFEQVKDIYLCSEMFTVENDLLTPTLKSKRPKLKEHFKKQIEEMYSHLD